MIRERECVCARRLRDRELLSLSTHAKLRYFNLKRYCVCVRKCCFNKRREYQRRAQFSREDVSFHLPSSAVGNFSKASMSRCADNNYHERVGKYRQSYNWTKRRRPGETSGTENRETYV